jgi:4-hydroxythreonine-4-phosphate dehydrogenase
MTQQPIVAITMGDPNGIGPEIIAKALAIPEVRLMCVPLVIGNVDIMNQAIRLAQVPLRIVQINNANEVDSSTDAISIIDPGNLDLTRIVPGQISPSAGKASIEWVKLAARLCLEATVTAMATAPINKESASASGYQGIGHMELLQSMTDAPEVATMLISGSLRVVHLTTHRSLKKACDAVTKENVLSKIKLTHSSFERLGFTLPRIGVSALNPHASDGGLLGNEEGSVIAPAIAEARASDINASGPIPADTIFLKAIDGIYDVVLCMYHDQGHIPIKVHGFEQSVAINLGLPLVRTSVDHGTAFDIAGKGIAQATSMAEAIKLAASVGSGQGLVH